jgi:D-alanyl-D-alanine carboxypeptidase (penicillin-binding protein 5/6)
MQAQICGPAAVILSCLLIGLGAARANAARAPLESRVANPYLGAIVLDADTGQVLFEDKSDAKGYPASVLKLMNLLIILEKVKEGKILSLEDKVTVTAEAAKIGGSQVFLKEHEVFTVDELLYALMVQSANDAAVALAIHVAGSKDGFVALMNERAKALGMKATAFHSVHGLPPAEGQQPDVTTARDLGVLCREVLKYPDTLRYTSTIKRGFRNGTFTLETHNQLLGKLEGCDGLKTGWFKQSGYAIALTAKRGNTRMIAIVLGCEEKKVRDQKAAELLAKGFAGAPKKEVLPAPLPVTNTVPAPTEKRGWWQRLFGKR